jgi:cell division protein FtsI (penicillin-binding protein 3)
VPAEDPRLTIVAIVDEPRGEAWGGTVAAPIFRRVAEQALPYLGVSSQEPMKLAMAVHAGAWSGTAP